MPTVTVAGLNLTFKVERDQTIVEAAADQGIPIPFSCHSGTCGTCKARLISGSVTMLEDYSRFTLTDAERAKGLFLPCCAIPETDCTLASLQSGPIPSRRLDCTVSDIVDATHDIKIVKVRPTEAVRFLAGQDAELSFGSLPGRFYSMASRPGDRELEFHIRRVPGGKVSGYVHASLSRGSRVILTVPMGTSYLRPAHKGPILAVAGGSGLAPIKSIIDELAPSQQRPPIYLYFGVRSERDLYLSDYLRVLADAGTITYVPVLSEPGGNSSFRIGFLADAIGADFDRLDGFTAYLAGPPVMIETCRRVILSRGVKEDAFHADAF
jgi:CDP-4-dehydro-6-deoxyglucose reductase/ferredoxin-NAD(P)+ reductase (naphthalene dioxygenase ferredoxin-specific)